MSNPSTLLVAALGLGCAVSLGWAQPAYCWDDEGHEVIGLIADHYLQPAARLRVNAILAQDMTQLTPDTRIAQEATWADKYRDSDRHTSQIRYDQTRDWHFVDLELAGPDLGTACFGRPPLPAGTPASHGAAEDCVVDKIDQFAAELKGGGTGEPERLLALQFLLHFVGDIHQPLHASDDHDQGGNLKIVTAPGIAASTLHHDWDTEFVARLGENATAIAQRLIASISQEQRRQWASGSARDWALESFSVAKKHVYGRLPEPTSAGQYRLSFAYVSDATAVTAEQLSKAGVRLAHLLNQSVQ